MRKKENESKHDKFVRLAEARTNKIIETLQLLGNCSNTSFYEYSENEIDQIFEAIEIELNIAKEKFSKIKVEKTTKFSLRRRG